MYPDDRVRVLESDMRIVLDLPTLRVEPWRSGTDFFADLAHDGDQLLGVVRSPRVEQASTSYDGVVDFAAVLAKEAVAAELLAAAGVPVPRVLRLGRAWCLAELIESDVDFPTALVLPELGRLTRTIHTIRPRRSRPTPTTILVGVLHPAAGPTADGGGQVHKGPGGLPRSGGSVAA
jgi:hypothetical protein